MMDRSYPTSSFADPLVPPTQSTASWAYERSPASIKPSYGAAHLDSDVLQRQSYASTNQLPTYTTSHHPTGLSGTFDSSGNTSETSIMSFLSAMESRSLQAGPASASLLPPFRTPSWPMGTNSSTAELYLTGALPSTATFPSPAALSSYQHTGAFPSRSYTTTTLPLQDPAFSTSTNGLFSHHDPLIHLKSSQAVLPTALAFSHLSTPSLGSSIPIQSSTYRSAQESAPHLLQPQFSLLPSALPVSHGASQPCGPSVFSGSIERALQRECSVIKHHQRPSSSHTASSEQLSSAQQSLQGYLGSASETEVSYQQDPSHQTPASGRTDSTQGVNGGPHADTGSVTPETYSSASVAKSKHGSTKLGIHLSRSGEDIRSQSLTEGSPENYSSPGQKQSSALLARQSAQLPSMMSSGLSQNYIISHTQSQPSHSTSDKIPSLYKTLPSFSSQSVASVSQALIYSSAGLHQDQDVQYGAQVQSMCQGNLSERYPSSHSQGAPNVSYPSQSPEQVAVTQTYATGQSLNSSYPSTCTQSLATSNSTQGFTLMQSSVGGKTSGSLSLQQTQASKYLLSTPSPMYTLAQAAHAQALQNNARPSAQDLKPSYGKNKHDELPIQELQAPMQAPLDTQTDSSMSAHNNVVYVVSKNDDRYKTQSVIRSSSREDQLLGLSSPKMVQVKDERIDSLSQQHIHLSSANSLGTADSKTTPSQLPQSSEQLRQHSLLKSPELHQQNHQIHIQPHSPAPQTQYIRIPSTQFLLESNQMILLQQPLVHPSHNAAKVPPTLMQPNQGSGLVQVQYLHMGRELMSPVAGETQSTQGTLVSEQIAASTDPTKQPLKDHYSQPENHPSHDPKSHFALNSICFPDSMLMGDDRSILSNVDDILAATVAACGVTPQDFVKATSAVEGEMAVMGSHVDAKDPYEGVDMRHMSPSFSSTQQPITNTNAYSMAMTLNGGHIVTNCQSVHQNDGADIHPNGDGGSSESDYQLTSQVYASSGTENRVKGNTKGIKREDSLSECPGSEGFSKKKARSASLATPAGPEENGAVKSAKRCGQAKRQNSRGSDTSSPSTSHPAYDGYQQQERMRQKIREVEEKQPEVKTGFMGSFLDFIKSGPKNQYSPTPTRTISRPRKPSTSSKQTTSNPLPSLPPKLQCSSGPIVSQEGHGRTSQQKRLDEELQKNLETLPSFSSDEEENTSKNQALRNSISSALSSLDESSDRRVRADNGISSALMKPDQAPGMPQSVADTQLLHAAALKQTTSNTQHGVTVSTAQEGLKDTLPGRLAVQLSNVAVEGLTDEELSDSGGEGMYRERDEFVVRNEDIESLKVTMRAGREPPAIWKVQKALLQKFVPELRDGKRVFSATNSYLGYFGDAKTMYQRVYVKFLDTVNKREYVRVCSRKPRCKPMNSLRGSQVKTLLGLMATPASVSLSQKPRPKLSKTRAEPPPKKRKKWKEFSPAPSSSSEEEEADDDEFSPPLPFASRLLNTRTMKETFRSFVELLIGVALDEDVLTTLERENDELRLPHMKRVDGMITDNRKRLLHKLHIGQLLKTALDSFPEISVVTELKKDGETPAFKVRLSGKAYNKKTMKPYKMPTKVPLEYTVDQQKTQWFSLYHSLQHYKYHTYLTCKEEIASLRAQTGQLGQEETVQRCLQNGAWVEGLFDRFGELLSQVQQACR